MYRKAGSTRNPQGGKPTTIKDKPRADPDTKTVDEATQTCGTGSGKKNRKPVAPKPKANVKVYTKKLTCKGCFCKTCGTGTYA